MNNYFYQLSWEIWSIILHNCDFSERPNLRLVCVLFSKLIKPRIAKFKDLIGKKVIGLYKPQDSSYIIPENLTSKCKNKNGENIYDRYNEAFYLFIEDERPVIKDNDRFLKNLRIIVFLNDNIKNFYQYLVNWHIHEVNNNYINELKPGYKHLGEIIETIIIDNNENSDMLNQNNITAENSPYYDDKNNFYFIQIILKIKTIKLGIDGDYYYKSCIWDVI